VEAGDLFELVHVLLVVVRCQVQHLFPCLVPCLSPFLSPFLESDQCGSGEEPRRLPGSRIAVPLLANDW
jgi:hypothetical protein